MEIGILVGLLTGVLVAEAHRFPFVVAIRQPLRFISVFSLATLGVLISAFALDRAGLPEGVHTAFGSAASLKSSVFLTIVGLFIWPFLSGLIEGFSGLSRGAGKFLARHVLRASVGILLLLLFLKEIEDPKVNESAAGAIAMVLVAAVLFYRFRTKKKS